MVAAPTATDKFDLRPDDILGAILAIAEEQNEKEGSKRFAFRGHDSDLQELFSELVQEFNEPLMRRFVFSDKGPMPYSPILSDAVSKLQLCGFVGRENPDYEILFVRPAAVNYFESVIKKRLSKDQ
ncbi:MAG: hypothetical protein ACRD3D_03145, partial [Terriglobia bacterium]